MNINEHMLRDHNYCKMKVNHYTDKIKTDENHKRDH